MKMQCQGGEKGMNVLFYCLYLVKSIVYRSIGYHADDGKTYIGLGFGMQCTIGIYAVVYLSFIGSVISRPWAVNDVVGCGIDFARRSAFFTKNGILLGIKKWHASNILIIFFLPCRTISIARHEWTFSNHWLKN
jgi:hypothetical protein